jgi:hypothetical protein
MDVNGNTNTFEDEQNVQEFAIQIENRVEGESLFLEQVLPIRVILDNFKYDFIVKTKQNANCI